MFPVPAQRNGDRAAGRSGIAVGAENQDGVMGERAACRGYPPGSGIGGTCGMFDGGEGLRYQGTGGSGGGPGCLP